MEFFTEINGIIESEQMLSGQIHRNTDLVIDQEYSPTSDNPLSGAAVHEAFTKEYITSGRLQGPPIGTGVTIEGNGNVATGNYSHAEGSGTVASGDNSHTEGSCTKAAGANQHVQGKYNELDTNSKYAHIVGNGTDDTHRSNAHTLDWDGNAWYAGKVSQAKEPTKKDDLATVNYVVEQGSHNEKVKGLLKEVATPAAFVDSDGDAIRNLKVVGASAQNGTPTPTTPIEIQNTGNELKVVSCGKNLFDADAVLPSLSNPSYPTAHWVKQSDGSFYLSNIGTLYKSVWYKNRQKLTGPFAITFCHRNNATDSEIYFTLFIYYTDGTKESIKCYADSTFKSYSWVSNPNKIVDYIYQGYHSKISTAYVKDIMIAYSSDSTHEPYQGNNYTIPLIDINGTTHTMRQFDEVKKHSDGKWYFDCQSHYVECNGTESNWTNYSSYKGFIFITTDIYSEKDGPGFCNRYKRLVTSTLSETGVRFGASSTSNNVYFFNVYTDSMTLDAWKQQLATWNTAGTPLAFLYKTKTITSYELSVETSLTLESIYSQKGICNIYFINNVIPSGSFEYVQALEESIADVGNEYFYKIAENSLTTPAIVADSYGGKLINEVVTGKSEQTRIANTNLLPYPYSATTTTQNGITFTDNGNGTITVNGIATANITFQFISNNSTILNGIYTLSGCPIGGGYDSYYLQVTNHYDLGNNVSFTVTNTTIGDCFIVIKSGVTINNLVFKPQLQAGSTATDFVRPTSGMGSPSPNYPQDINNVGNSLSLVSCGINLIPYPYVYGTKTNNGVTYTDNGDGTITLNGTATGWSSLVLQSNLLLPAGKYSAIPTTEYLFEVKTMTGTLLTRNGTFSLTVPTKIIISIQSTTPTKAYNNVVVKPMLLRGEYTISTLPTYEKYNAHTYTIPLTDINGTTHTMRQFDEVKKHSDGKWYFDCNSAVKEFNGTENYFGNYALTNAVNFYTALQEQYSTMLLNYSMGNKTTFKFTAWTNNDPNSYHSFSGYMYIHLHFPNSILGLTGTETNDEKKTAFTTYLSNQYSSGNPVIVEYPTAVTTSYELSASTSAILDSIAIQKGNANIYFTNAVTPTMTTDYPLDLKLYTDNKMSALEARLTALENIQ